MTLALNDPVTRDKVQQHLLTALGRYWVRAPQNICLLPIPWAADAVFSAAKPVLDYIQLPKWAEDLGVNGRLLVPAYAVVPGESEPWQRVDWWEVMYWYLNCSAERAYENLYGPIHSYAMRLDGWNPAIWDYAWVNRIALFLRRWAAHSLMAMEGELFGELPQAQIVITHDVDAVKKTLAIRIKQTAFCGFNGIRQLFRGRISGAATRFARGVRFFLGNNDYQLIKQIAQQEDAVGLRSCFNLYGGGNALVRSPASMLFDPGYDVGEPALKACLRRLATMGWEMGLHQSFDAWEDPEKMRIQKTRVEIALGSEVTTCRQHWLRYSWKVTWRAQAQAGFLLDTTLGFNDRPGFRAGAALQFSPFEFQGHSNFEVLPMVLMDSHLYDYMDLDREGRETEMRRWLNEVKFVRGQASVIWHTHVLADDYGWGEGFDQLLAEVGGNPN